MNETMTPPTGDDDGRHHRGGEGNHHQLGEEKNDAVESTASPVEGSPVGETEPASAENNTKDSEEITPESEPEAVSIPHSANPTGLLDEEELKYLWNIEQAGTATSSLRFIVADGATLPTEVVLAGHDAYVSLPDLEALIRCNTRFSKSPPHSVDEQEIVLLPDGVLDDLGAADRNELFVESGIALDLLEQLAPYGPMSAWLLDDLIADVRQNYDEYYRATTSPSGC